MLHNEVTERTIFQAEATDTFRGTWYYQDKTCYSYNNYDEEIEKCTLVSIPCCVLTCCLVSLEFISVKKKEER